jgi:hypothetical protein
VKETNRYKSNDEEDERGNENKVMKIKKEDKKKN